MKLIVPLLRINDMKKVKVPARFAHLNVMKPANRPSDYTRSTAAQKKRRATRIRKQRDMKTCRCSHPLVAKNTPTGLG